MVLLTAALLSDKLKSNNNIESYNNKYNASNHSPAFNAFMVIVVIISIILGMIKLVTSPIIAYKCNRNENTVLKVFIILFAFLFSEFYIPYYLIKYVILDNKCSDNLFIRNRNRNRNNRNNK